VIHVSEINKVCSEADAEGLDSFFLEVLSKPGVRAKKPEAIKVPKIYLFRSFFITLTLNVFFKLVFDGFNHSGSLFFGV
jgi:hypothetical protein